MSMNSAQIREAFHRFFESQAHTSVVSSSLVPHNDPTLLFTNAGMNQFKDCFLGTEVRPYKRAVSVQKCVRAGGKHNDLDNVGYTARHHTFFEMLGNFSFGDYFKREAIEWAWIFLTSPQWLAIPAERLWVTVYASDQEAYEIWHQNIGISSERIIQIGDNKGSAYASDNFWSMGDTGPCGPCTEIFYDHGAHISGGLPGTPEEDGDRYVEIWNNVFMQYNRQADGSLQPLPAPSVDTGMGLERITAVMQQVSSNYDTDIFLDIRTAASQVLGCSNDENPSLKVISDHIRAICFLMADGVVPSNEGRGYVLRRILRRAARHGHQLGSQKPFLHLLVQPLSNLMGSAYPELLHEQRHIQQTVLREEEQFIKTMEQGLRLLEQALLNHSGGELSGELVFRLYDTYGFPMDLTADIARERGLNIDTHGFEREMALQRERAQKSGAFRQAYQGQLNTQVQTIFLGYEVTESEAQIREIIRQGESINRLETGEAGAILLDQSPFYAESGGQIGDSGVICLGDARFEVQNTIKQGQAHIHEGIMVEGHLDLNAAVSAKVQDDVRTKTACNHTATHLLHAVLRKQLGEHIQQRGSLVDNERLRFDFSHAEPLSQDEIKNIESHVNDLIRANTQVQTQLMDIDAAKSQGALALFGEKYADQVRVLTMSEGFSMELCGGTHARFTGDIGLFRVTSESGVASGIRRIEAITAETAWVYSYQQSQQLAMLATQLKSPSPQLLERVEQLQERTRQAEKALENAQIHLASQVLEKTIKSAQHIEGIQLTLAVMDDFNSEVIQQAIDKVRHQYAGQAILIAQILDNKLSFFAGISPDLTSRLKAGDWIKQCMSAIGGKGGGRADTARAGGGEPSRIQEVWDAATLYIKKFHDS